MKLSLPKIRRQSLFVKIVGIMALSIGGIGATITVSHLKSAEQMDKTVVQERGKAETKLLASIIAGSTRFAKQEDLTKVLESSMRNSEGQSIGALVIGADGGTLAALGSMKETAKVDLELVQQAMKGGKPVQSSDGFTIAQPITFGAGQAVVGALATKWTPAVLMAKQWRTSLRDLGISAIAFFIAVAIAIYIISHVLLSPLQRMQGAIHGLERRKYEDDIPEQSRKDEIGEISKSLEDLRKTLIAAQVVEREALFESAAFTGSSAAMMLVDTDFNIRSVNPGVVKLFKDNEDYLKTRVPGFDPDAIVGSSVDRFHPDTDQIRHRLLNLKEAAYSTTVPFGDARIQLSVSRISNAEGELAGFVLEWADVTRDWFNGAMIDAINGGQLKAEFSVDGTLTEANALFCEALGLPLDNLKGLKLQELAQPDEETNESGKALVARVREESTHLGRTRLAVRKGNSVLIDGSLSSVKDHMGEPIRLLLIGKDVTRQDAEIRAARQERQQAEEQQNKVVDELRIGLRKLAEGNLSSEITEPFAGAYEDLRVDYNNTVKNLAAAMREISDNAENIRNEARDISSTADGLSRRTESTAATLEQTAAALDQLTTAVKAAAAGAGRADLAVKEARVNAEDSGNVVVETVSAMGQISESSDRITSIIKVIDDIAFQTNLLALNAGVEAARAGDAGRGFAVVASEVRALAQRSSDAAREINELIAQSAGQVRRGVDLVGKTGNALSQIVESVTEISTLVSDIAESSQQQSANLEEINLAVNQLDQSTQQNAARLEETTAASEALRNDAVALVSTVSHFSLPETAEAEGSSVLSFRGKARQAPSPDKPAPQKKVAQARQAASAKPAARASTEEMWQDF